MSFENQTNVNPFEIMLPVLTFIADFIENRSVIPPFPFRNQVILSDHNFQPRHFALQH